MARSQEVWGGAELAASIAAAERALEAFIDCGNDEGADRLREAIDSAKQMRFAIGVVGRTNRGKSTLINGLLGRTDDMLAPVEKAPATNVVTCFASGDREAAWAVFNQDGEPRKADPIPFTEIKSYACEELNPENVKGVARIEVVGPFSKLPKNIVLVDTPGTHNALSPVHGEVLLNYLPRLDTVIFLISADAPIVDAELELLAQIRNCDIGKIFFALNKADRVDADELAEGMAHNRKVLASIGLSAADMFPISAKQYWQTGSEPGVEKLLDAMHRLVDGERGQTLAQKLAAVTQRLTDSVSSACREELEACRKTDAELRQEIADITSIQKRLTDDRPGRERRFRRQWLEAVSTCEDSLCGVRTTVLAECRKIVEETPSLQLAPLGQTIHTTIAKKLDDALQPHCERMRKEIEDATRNLEVDFNMQLQTMEGSEGTVKTLTSNTGKTVSIMGAAVLPAIGAAVCSQVPGLVATAIMSAAPTVVAVTWNPLTWIMAAGGGAAAGATSLAAGAAGVLLSPVAAVGVPVLLGYAGYRMATTWVAKNAQTRDELTMAVRDRVEQLVGELKTNLGLLRRKDEDILAQFNDILQQQIDRHRVKLEECVAQRPSPARIEALERSVARLQFKSTVAIASTSESRQPLF